jgi:hypothetical protein
LGALRVAVAARCRCVRAIEGQTHWRTDQFGSWLAELIVMSGDIAVMMGV